VRDAVSRGAKVLCGGKPNAALLPGLFYEPTVLTNVNHSMRIVNEEVFGPVLTVITVRNDEECVRLINSTPYGLGSRCVLHLTAQLLHLCYATTAAAVAPPVF
jgi:acyl-CoA reductase-like NAD-dependent aldehyde dehydrogenase